MEEYYCYGVEVGSVSVLTWYYTYVYIIIGRIRRKEKDLAIPLDRSPRLTPFSIRIYLQIRILINDAKYRLTWPWSWLRSLPFLMQGKGEGGMVRRAFLNYSALRTEYTA